MDTAKQHLSILKVLEVSVDERLVVRILERALPLTVRQKWEESLTLDEMPNLDTIYRFITTMAFTLSTMERESRSRDKERDEETGRNFVEQESEG